MWLVLKVDSSKLQNLKNLKLFLISDVLFLVKVLFKKLGFKRDALKFNLTENIKTND